MPHVQERKGQYLTLLVFITAIVTVSNVFVGSRDIEWQVTVQALFHFNESDTEHLIVHFMRLPRAIIAMIAGAALGVAGTLIQAFTRNPLADTGILGINAGATTAIVAAIAIFHIHEIALYVWFGFLGAGLTGIAIYYLASSSKQLSHIRLVLSGAALSIILLSLTHIIILNSEEAIFDQFRHWISGSLQGRRFEVLVTLAAGTVPFLLGALFLGKTLNLLAMGDHQARSLGLNISTTYLLIGILIIVLAGLTTAAIGPISFIGLVAPHIARLLIGANYPWLIPYSMAIGGLLLSTADLLGKLIGSPGEVSAGIMSAIIGAPFFIFLIRKLKSFRL